MAPFPLIKLAYLVVKAVSKPVSQQLARTARHGRLLGPWVCTPLGRAVHTLQCRLKLRELGVGGALRAKVPHMEETKAAEAGAEVLAEVILVSLVSVFLVYQYRFHSDPDTREEDLEELHRRVESVQGQLEEQARLLQLYHDKKI